MVFFFRTWMLGLKSLLLHPMRSMLTVLGIFIGVTSVIWLVAIGEGISREAQRQIESLGADNIIILSVKPPSEATRDISGPLTYGLTRQEHEMLTETIPTITSSLPIREIRRQISYGGTSVDGRLVGCTVEYQDVNKLEVARGRFLSEQDNEEQKNYCVLAARLAETLFGFEDPLGKNVYLQEHNDFYVVVGVLHHREATAAVGGSLSGQDFSTDMYIPIRTMRARIGDEIFTRTAGGFSRELVELNQVTLRIEKVEDVLATADVVRASLRSHDAMQDVSIIAPRELLQQAETTRLMFMLFMGMIAAISLLVGGIGIMNIMLATVTERTREIGIRRALGAKKGHIITQFLAETVSLTMVGGLVGVMVGLACPYVIRAVRWVVEWGAELMNSNLLEQLPETVRTVDPVIVPLSIPVAFLISMGVGVLFGIFPAIRAAEMDPIEALRHE